MTPKTNVTSAPEGNTLRQGRVFTLVSEKTQNTGKANTGMIFIIYCDVSTVLYAMAMLLMRWKYEPMTMTE